MWVLRSINDDTSHIIHLTSGTLRIVGRGLQADLVIDSMLLSRVHCSLSATDTELLVEDLGSTNGTFVNGKRVSRSRLNNGDRLRLGRLELEVLREQEQTSPTILLP